MIQENYIMKFLQVYDIIDFKVIKHLDSIELQCEVI